MTPAVRRIYTLLQQEFPDIDNKGFYSCRNISGTLIPSQHSYTEGLTVKGNAGDVTSPFRDQPRTPRQAEKAIYKPHMDYLDAVFQYLDERRDDLDIRTLLWRVPAHWDHIHYDCWPRGVGKGPCMGGKLQVQHKDGSYGNSFLNGEELEVAIRRGDRGDSVKKVQEAINKAGHDPQIKVDGIYGKNTAAGVAWIQGLRGISVDGDLVADLTAAAIWSILYPPQAVEVKKKTYTIIGLE